jgi:hypothetical protein
VPHKLDYGTWHSAPKSQKVSRYGFRLKSILISFDKSNRRFGPAHLDLNLSHADTPVIHVLAQPKISHDFLGHPLLR